MEPRSESQSEAAKSTADHGLSLEALSAGFAEMLRSGDDPYSAAAAPAAIEDLVAPNVETLPDVEITPRSILEAMLFVGRPKNEPLSTQEIAATMRGVHPSEIDELVRELNEQYRRNFCPYTIESHGAGYRLALLPDYAGLRDRLAGKIREARLSRAAIEVLALVAYNGSITSDEVSRIRGRTSGAVLAQLVRRQLLKIDRSAQQPRKARYSTTRRFLELFGLASLDDLPRSQHIEER